MDVYEFMDRITNKYIFINEYFSLNPVEVRYRNHSEKLFKRDFAKEMMDCMNIEIVDYGFTWKHDPNFPLDDSNWFLFKKMNSD